MKTIGFIDIHPQSPLCGAHVSGPSGGDPSAIYLFRDAGKGYMYEKNLDDHASPEEWKNVDEVYVSVPATLLDFRVLSFPFADQEKIAEVIPLELSNLIISGPGEIVFDSIVLGGSDASVDVLVVYIRTEVLKRILADLAQRNIDPRIVTSLELRPPAGDGNEAGREPFFNSLGPRLMNPAPWDQARRIRTAGQEILEPTINLRKGLLAYTKDSAKTGKALRMTAVLAFLLVFSLHANFLFQGLMTKKESADIAGKMRLSYGSLFPGEKKIIDEIYQLKSHIKESREIGNLLSGTAPLHLLLGLSRSMEANVVYTDISLEKGLIKMKAEARSMDDLAKTQKRLSDVLTDVSISDIKPAAQGKVLFTVVAKDQVW
jgi:type II secretory pathway component PulL